MRQLSIIAETLSAGSPVAQLLSERGVEIVKANLPAGNFQITQSSAVLMVSMAEFTSWIAEKTVFRRVTEFKRAVAEPIVIVEGLLDLQEPRKVSLAATRGALAFIAVHNRIPILFGADAKECAELLYAMLNQVQNGMGLTVDLAKIGTEPPVVEPTSPTEAAPDHTDAGAGGNGNGNGKSPADLKALPEQIVRMIPEIGPTSAKALLRRFGNLKGVFAANANDLTKIEGIGPKKAKKIAAFLSGRGLR